MAGTAWKADLSDNDPEGDDKDPEATILGFDGGGGSFSFSNSFELLGMSAALKAGISLLTALVMDRGRLSSMALRALSVEGEKIFTGDTMADADILAGEGVETMAED